MSRWFRHYAGMMRDEKLVRAALKSKQPVERVIWVWGAILESAAEVQDGGRFDFDAAEAAYFLRSDEADIRAILAALADLERLAGDRVVKWGERQFESDRSAPRQAAYRERKRQENRDGDNRQTDGDDGVTATSRHGDAPETETETETERKKDIRAVADATRPDEPFEKFWKVYPKRDGANPKTPARKKFTAAVKSGTDPEAITASAGRYAVECRSKNIIGTPYVAQAATWLNQQRWTDYAPGATGPPNDLTEDQRAELFAKLRQSNGTAIEENTGQGNDLPGVGACPREGDGARREGPETIADH